MTHSRITLFSASGSGSPNNCKVNFSCELPIDKQYQLVVESFCTSKTITEPYCVSASGIFNQPSWDNAVSGERINLVASNANSIINNISTESIGFRLGSSIKSQMLNIQIWDSTGKTLFPSFPSWVMQCVITPLADS